jgi:hypothetical protein
VAHLGAVELERRDVRQDQAVVFLQSGNVFGDAGGLDDGDVDVLRAQRARERRRVALVLVGQQDCGVPRTTTVPTARLFSSIVSPSTSSAAW